MLLYTTAPCSDEHILGILKKQYLLQEKFASLQGNFASILSSIGDSSIGYIQNYSSQNCKRITMCSFNVQNNGISTNEKVNEQLSRNTNKDNDLVFINFYRCLVKY